MKTEVITNSRENKEPVEDSNYNHYIVFCLVVNNIFVDMTV